MNTLIIKEYKKTLPGFNTPCKLLSVYRLEVTKGYPYYEEVELGEIWYPGSEENMYKYVDEDVLDYVHSLPNSEALLNYICDLAESLYEDE